MESRTKQPNIFLSPFASYGFMESGEVCQLVTEGVTYLFLLYTLFSCITKTVQSFRYVGLLGIALQKSSSSCLVLTLGRQFRNYGAILGQNFCLYHWWAKCQPLTCFIIFPVMQWQLGSRPPHPQVTSL